MLGCLARLMAPQGCRCRRFGDDLQVVSTDHGAGGQLRLMRRAPFPADHDVERRVGARATSRRRPARPAGNAQQRETIALVPTLCQ